MPNLSRDFRAFIAPFAVFMLLLGVIPLLDGIFKNHDSVFLRSSQYWVFPLQTVVCGAVLWWFWPCYEFGRVRFGLTISIAVLVLALWISPQELFGFPRRTGEGFDPTIFQANRPLFITVLAFRFIRLVIIVPLLEEIFWRGFLLRDLIHPRFNEVPIGTFSWESFGAVSFAFGLAHWGKETWPPGPDFVPAILTGALYNLVAYRTKSLSSCVVAHAVTNLLLGIYILQTRQWGFW